MLFRSKSIGGLIRSTHRKNDIFSRFGVDEFCVVLPKASLANGLMVAERTRRAIENFPFVVRCRSNGEIDKNPLPVTVSIGVCTYAVGAPSQALLFNANQALELAKEKGRNRVEGYQPV